MMDNEKEKINPEKPVIRQKMRAVVKIPMLVILKSELTFYERFTFVKVCFCKELAFVYH